MTYKTFAAADNTYTHIHTHTSSAAHWQRVDVPYLRLGLPLCVCVCAWACLMLHAFRRCCRCGCNDMPRQRQPAWLQRQRQLQLQRATNINISGEKVAAREAWSAERAAKYSSCEVATRNAPLYSGPASVLNTFCTYLKCCSFYSFSCPFHFLPPCRAAFAMRDVVSNFVSAWFTARILVYLSLSA